MTQATVQEATETRPVKTADPAKNGYWWGTGRRKTSVARVRIKPGDGKFRINGRSVDAYFTEVQHRLDALAALRVTEMTGKMDVFVKVEGGGPTGQSGAILVGVARALKSYDPQLEGPLRDNSYLTIDSRQVERKKYGQAGARKRFQFSKR